MDISHHFKFCQNRWNHLILDLGLEEIMNCVDFLLTLSNSHLFVWAHLFFNTLGFVAVLQAYIWRENSNTNMFAQINYFWLVYGVLETVLLKIFHLYLMYKLICKFPACFSSCSAIFFQVFILLGICNISSNQRDLNACVFSAATTTI